MRQGQEALLHRERFLDHFRIDIVELIATGQRRVRLTSHLGRIFSDKVGHVGHVKTFLEHEVHAAQIVGKEIQLREPGIEPIELSPEPGVDARAALFIGLMDVDMQERAVDAFAEEAVSARLQNSREIAEHEVARGKGLRVNLLLPVNMPAGRGGPIFDIAQGARRPELSANFVGLSAILEELTRETPVTVILQPGSEAVLIANLAQTADVVIGDLIGHQTAQVPKETIGSILALDDDPFQDRQERNRVIAVFLLEIDKEGVGIVLAAHFVAVHDDYFPRLAVFGRNPPDYFAHKRIEMGSDVLFAHLIDLQSRSFFAGGSVFDAGRLGTHTHNNPVARRSIPGELVTQ